MRDGGRISKEAGCVTGRRTLGRIASRRPVCAVPSPPAGLQRQRAGGVEGGKGSRGGPCQCSSLRISDAISTPAQHCSWMAYASPGSRQRRRSISSGKSSARPMLGQLQLPLSQPRCCLGNHPPCTRRESSPSPSHHPRQRRAKPIHLGSPWPLCSLAKGPASSVSEARLGAGDDEAIRFSTRCCRRIGRASWRSRSYWRLTGNRGRADPPACRRS